MAISFLGAALLNCSFIDQVDTKRALEERDSAVKRRKAAATKLVCELENIRVFADGILLKATLANSSSADLKIWRESWLFNGLDGVALLDDQKSEWGVRQLKAMYNFGLPRPESMFSLPKGKITKFEIIQALEARRLQPGPDQSAQDSREPKRLTYKIDELLPIYGPDGKDEKDGVVIGEGSVSVSWSKERLPAKDKKTIVGVSEIPR